MVYFNSVAVSANVAPGCSQETVGNLSWAKPEITQEFLMIALLVALFVIALVVTFIGLLLSSRTTQSPPRYVSDATRGTGMRQAYGARNVRLRRPMAVYEEPRATGWANIIALLNVRTLFAAGAKKQTPWLGILFVLMTLFIICCVSLRTLFPNAGVIAYASWLGTSQTSAALTAPTINTATQLLATSSGAAKALVRIGQLDSDQYASTSEYDTWAYSTCSAASMTEVINAYGHHYRLTDILAVESRLGEITPSDGLLEPTGIAHTVAKFGFKTITLTNDSLDNLIAIANRGWPVIVSFPPDHWTGGHILVLRGGNSSTVDLADSSKLNMTVMPRSTFTYYWEGFAVVPIPAKL